MLRQLMYTERSFLGPGTLFRSAKFKNPYGHAMYVRPQPSETMCTRKLLLAMDLHICHNIKMVEYKT